MTTLDDLFPSNYLKASDVVEADLTLTIKGIDKEKMKNKEGVEELKPVLYFKETDKGIVLNKTNATTISKLYPGPIEGWIGKRITLSSETVTAFGETKEALRVRSRIPALASAPQVPGDPTEGLYSNTSAFSIATLRKWTDLVKQAMAAGVVMSFNLDETDTPENFGTRINAVKAQIEKANTPENLPF